MGRAAARIKTYQERKLLTTLDNDILLCYIILMMSDPYSQMTDDDHADLCAWMDDLDAEPVYDDPHRCGCEDAPCCGCQ